MVDVGDKPATVRRAVAEGCITLAAETLKLIEQGSHKKGDVLGVARIAGIMAAKKTSELIPLCHPIPITSITVDFDIDKKEHCVICTAAVATRAQTGIEMEALTAVQTALLTIYDMCKSVDRGMVIDSVRLLEKTGGKSGDWHR